MTMPTRADEDRREATAAKVAAMHGLRMKRAALESIESFERTVLERCASPLIAAARLARKDAAS